METYGKMDVYIHAILTSALDGDEWSAWCPGRFIAKERAPYTNWIEGWEGPRSSMDDIERRNSYPYQ
jgi:hypothetical protein